MEPQNSILDSSYLSYLTKFKTGLQCVHKITSLQIVYQIKESHHDTFFDTGKSNKHLFGQKIFAVCPNSNASQMPKVVLTYLKTKIKQIKQTEINQMPRNQNNIKKENITKKNQSKRKQGLFMYKRPQMH